MTSKAYKLYDPIFKKTCTNRDVVFYENKKWRWDTNKSGQQSYNLSVNFDKEKENV
jgi:hypothetical protein